MGVLIFIAEGCSNPLGGPSSANSNYHPGVTACADYSFYQWAMKYEPAAYWRLDDTTTTALDQTTNGNNGTYMNGVTLGVAGAVYGDGDTAATFNGTNQFIAITEHKYLPDLGNARRQSFYLE